MADIRCSHCGRDNPDFLDVCQFCQSPLKSESMLHIGDEPTKRSTGELEPILPDWLKDVRQQARESAEEDAAQEDAQSRVQKEEAPDLLAGLAFQAESEEEEIPDWLASLNPVEEKSSTVSSAESSSDFFAQFEQSEKPPEMPAPIEVVPEEPPGGLKADEEQDELSAWLSQSSLESSEPLPFESGTSPDEKGWMDESGLLKTTGQRPAAEKEPEDLGWLHDLEASAKQEGEPAAPQMEADFPFAQSDSQDDLSWLNTLGGTSAPAFGEAAPAETASSQDDLDWLKNLGGLEQAPSFEETPTLPPSSPKEDLSWFNDLGGTAVPAFAEEIPAQPDSSQDDLSWLNNLGGTTDQPLSFEETPKSPPPAPQDDLSWLDTLGEVEEKPAAAASAQPFAGESDSDWLNKIGEQLETASPPAPVSPFVPRRTAPLNENTTEDSIPNWLKEAMEKPSMPPPGAASLDWFTAKEKTADEKPPQTTPEPASVEPDLAAAPPDSSSMSSQEVDSMFAVEMPDWLARESGSTEATATDSALPPTSDTLAPVELPSWVQAMRPVESVIEETSASAADEVIEREGPLAGFSGLIPSAPIGSSRRPRAFSLKLQATDEQQANASLLEQIIARETAAGGLKSVPVVASQRLLRWALTGLFLLVLGVMIGLGSQTMPVVAPAGVNELSNIVSTLPDSSPILVVIDYEPALAGEMEAGSGPLLDQLAVSRHSNFIFLSTSPNGSALAERLMTDTKINQPAPDGAGYQLGAQYFNIGFLPGGSAGVLGFLENPGMAMPAANVNNFSEFAAVIVLTDHAESSRVWVEQLERMKQIDPALARQPLLMVSSAQAGPMLQPYVSSGQVDGMINGLSEAAKYESINNSRPGIARTYWDAFGVGLMMAVVAIGLGGLWSLFTGMRARRAETGQG